MNNSFLVARQAGLATINYMHKKRYGSNRHYNCSYTLCAYREI